MMPTTSDDMLDALGPSIRNNEYAVSPEQRLAEDLLHGSIALLPNAVSYVHAHCVRGSSIRLWCS
jgi:hypothetical protein